MLAEMKDLVRAHSACVLATSSGDRPYCSLMAYVANDDVSEIYLVTQRSTRKFANLAANPAVSLLIDTRNEVPRPEVRALTVEGKCVPVDDPARKEQIRAQLLAMHPQLATFLDHEDCAILCVTVTSFLLLKGLTDAHYVALD